MGKQFVLEPLSHGEVIQTIGTISQEDACHKHAKGNQDVLAERSLGMVAYPRDVHINQWVMGDIDGIGNVAQKLVDGCRFATNDRTARSDAHDEWEVEKDAQHFIESVGPAALALDGQAHPWHTKQNDHHQRAPPKASVHLDEPPHARQQQSAEEGIKQARGPNLQLVGRKAPTADDGIAGIIANGEDAQDIDV